MLSLIRQEDCGECFVHIGCGALLSFWFSLFLFAISEGGAGGGWMMVFIRSMCSYSCLFWWHSARSEKRTGFQ